jgi:glycosyltransferase involved in cell wall biosynthesis
VVDSARSIICVSEAERRLLIGHFPSATDKTVVIPNGVDLEGLRAAEPFRTGKTVIVSGGRLEPYKHVDVVIRAVALLDEDCELVITGDGPERVRLESCAREMGAATRVRFLGLASVEDLYRWYRTADVYVSMSSNEAMPVTLLEVLACGARVVCSDIPAHMDLKEKTGGPIGIAALTASPEELAQAIRAAITGRSPTVPLIPTWDDVTESTRQVYADVLAEGTPSPS